jgi:hypothetical protein
MSVKHGSTREDARMHLERAIQDVTTRYRSMIQQVQWSEDRNSVHLSGSGAEVDIRVDDREVHVEGDMPFLGGLLGGPLLLGLQGILQQHFPKRLT